MINTNDFIDGEIEDGYDCKSILKNIDGLLYPIESSDYDSELEITTIYLKDFKMYGYTPSEQFILAFTDCISFSVSFKLKDGIFALKELEILRAINEYNSILSSFKVYTHELDGEDVLEIEADLNDPINNEYAIFWLNHIISEMTNDGFEECFKKLLPYLDLKD